MPINIDGSKGIRQNTTEVTKIPVGTTAQRPANPEAGMMRFNTDERQVEGYNDSLDEWQPMNQLFQKLAATGGTVTDIIQDGQLFRVHAFTSDGTFEVTAGGGEVEYLIVGGGGSGSSRYSGGGGAGGLILGSTTLSPGAFSVTVGAGGTRNDNTGTSAENTLGDPGQDSSAFGNTAIGGGAGLPADLSDGKADQNGGSGGGGGNGGRALNPGSGIPGQGNDGGIGSDRIDGGGGYCGGGGGAGQKGEGATPNDGPGKGGDGINLSETFGNSFGDNGFFAGGGGGGGHDPTPTALHGTRLPGGAGGGGDSGIISPNDSSTTITNNTGSDGLDGQVNTGGGAGGPTTNTGSGGVAGNGGSGIVLIRYRIG